MENLKHAVGPFAKAPNNWEDVEIVQELLQLVAKRTNNMNYHPGFADGIIFPFMSRTVGCIRAFQGRFMNQPDGIVSPGRKTIRALSKFAKASNKLIPLPPSTMAFVNGSGCCFPLAQWRNNDYHRPTQGKDRRGTYFGAKRYSKKQGGFRRHAACDLIAPQGTPIFAVDTGKVSRISRNFITGKRKNGEEWHVSAVTIIHDHFTVRYAEVQNICVKRSDKEIKKGQKIAEVGKMKTSSMLHFEMYSGRHEGKLSVRDRKLTKEFSEKTPFRRRSDLIDPTRYLDSWKSNIPKIKAK